MNNWVTDHTQRYLSQRAADGQPFFLSVGFFDPHHPFDPCEPYASRFDAQAMPMPLYQHGEQQRMTPLARQHFDRCHRHCLEPATIKRTLAAYHAMIHHVDAMVGQIMTSLKTLGLADHTVVIFTSDHGEMLGDHGILHKGPMFYEGAVRVPLIWRLPDGQGPRGQVDHHFVSHVDLAPTVAQLAGCSGMANVQGHALFNADLKLRPCPPRDAALVEWREKRFQSDDPFLVARCLITDRWKLVHYHNQNFGELYDREHDPCEYNNLYGDPTHSTTIATLRDRLFAFQIGNEPCPPRLNMF